MKTQHKIWQNEWRAVMGKTTNVEVDPDNDFDLHFDIWELEKDKFFNLFESFPRGGELAKRAYRLRWGDLKNLNKKYANKELIQLTKEVIEIIQKS